jgi:hypothetical protein
MHVSRRSFIRGGVSAFTVTLAAPEFLCDLARRKVRARAIWSCSISRAATIR